MCKLTDTLKLNFLWLLFSLPIITVGVSTIAAFYVGMKMAEDNEGHIGAEFLKAFKENIRQGIPMSFILIISIWAVYLDFQIFSAAEENGVVFLIIGIISAYILTFALLYSFPLLARYENSIINTLKNSFRISMRYFLRSVFLLILVAIEIVIIMWNLTTLLAGLLIGPAFIILTISGPAISLFRRIDKSSDDVV